MGGVAVSWNHLPNPIPPRVRRHSSTTRTRAKRARRFTEHARDRPRMAMPVALYTDVTEAGPPRSATAPEAAPSRMISPPHTVRGSRSTGPVHRPRPGPGRGSPDRAVPTAVSPFDSRRGSSPAPVPPAHPEPAARPAADVAPGWWPVTGRSRPSSSPTAAPPAEPRRRNRPGHARRDLPDAAAPVRAHRRLTGRRGAWKRQILPGRAPVERMISAHATVCFQPTSLLGQFLVELADQPPCQQAGRDRAVRFHPTGTGHEREAHFPARLTSETLRDRMLPARLPCRHKAGW